MTTEATAIADQVAAMRKSAGEREKMCPQFYGFAMNSTCGCLERVRELRANADRLESRGRAEEVIALHAPDRANGMAMRPQPTTPQS